MVVKRRLIVNFKYFSQRDSPKESFVTYGSFPSTSLGDPSGVRTYLVSFSNGQTTRLASERSLRERDPFGIETPLENPSRSGS